MPRNTMNDLRNHLFETLEKLKDDEKPDLQRAKTIVDVAQTIIDSAKVEVELLSVIGSDDVKSAFFGVDTSGDHRLPAASPNLRQIGNGR
jgi:hypothetical protein